MDCVANFATLLETFNSRNYHANLLQDSITVTTFPQVNFHKILYELEPLIMVTGSTVVRQLPMDPMNYSRWVSGAPK